MDKLDHLALVVDDIDIALRWYHENFNCMTEYADGTWALLRFENIRLALVVREQHPAHVAVERVDAAAYGTLRQHRDGTASTYIHDPSGNVVEIVQAEA